MRERSLREIAGYERTVEEVLERIDHDSLEDQVLKGIYEEVRGRYNTVREWREDDDVDWVVVDEYLESAADRAETLMNAYDG